MEEFTAELYQHGALVAYLVVRLTAASDKGVLFPHDEIELAVGQSFTLVADDGRKGVIVLGAVAAGSTSAEFVVSGAFGA